MTTTSILHNNLMRSSSSIAKDMQNSVPARGKKNEASFDPLIVGSIRLQQSFPISDEPTQRSSKTPDTANPRNEIERAVSAAVAAGRRTEASGQLVVESFLNYNQVPMLHSPSNRASSTISSQRISSRMAENEQNGMEIKKSKPKGTMKRSSNDENQEEKKKQKVRRPKTSWNFFYSDFAKANSSHLSGSDLLIMSSKKYKSLTREEKAHYKNLAEADRAAVKWESHVSAKPQPNPIICPSLSSAKEAPILPNPARGSINIGSIRSPQDQARLIRLFEELPAACHLVDSFESPLQGDSSTTSPLPAPVTPSSREEKNPRDDFLPACFYARPPVDPFCELLHFENSDLQEEGKHLKRVSEANEAPEKQQVPSTLQESTFFSTPNDVANHLMHDFLNQFGLFWPFQYWMMHQFQSYNAPDSTHQQVVLSGCNPPIHTYYHDPQHPFRKFFHPCSSMYLSVMESLADKLARQVQVLEAFRSLARNAALAYPFFRDALHYVLQHADAKAFQPLLGVPESHPLSVSEGIYYGQRNDCTYVSEKK